MLTGLQPGDLMLILKPIYIHQWTGTFMRYTRGGMLSKHRVLTFWYPFGAAVLLGHLHV